MIFNKFPHIEPATKLTYSGLVPLSPKSAIPAVFSTGILREPVQFYGSIQEGIHIEEDALKI